MPRSVTPHRSPASRGPLGRLVGLILLAALATAPAFSQPPTQRPAQPPQPPGRRAAPADGPPTQAPVQGGQPVAPPREIQEGPDPTEAAPDQQLKTTGPELPDDFTPPAEIPEVMTLRKPLLTQEEIDKELDALRRLPGGGIDRLIQQGDPSNANKEALRRWANVHIAQMTAVDEWHKADGIRRIMMIGIRNAALSQANTNRAVEFRTALCAALTDACKQVLDNNFYVRMQAATLLSQLNVREEPPTGNRQPPISYVPAMAPLLDILQSEDQPAPVKVMAATGVGRIADYADLLPAELKFRAGDVMTQELAKPDTHWWYQMRLAESLAALELEYSAARQPIVIQALLAAVADESRDCVARSAAAKALGRTPIPAGAFDDKAAADRLVKLASDMSLAYNEKPGEIYWTECFANLYCTFVPDGREDVSRLPQNSLLRRGSLPAALDDAVERIRPVVKHIISQANQAKKAPIPTELIQRLNEFLAVAGGQ